MASVLGNLIFAGLQTLLTTQATLGATTGNLFSIATGVVQPLDVALFQSSYQGVGASSAGYGGATLPPILFTRTGATSVWLNPNTTAVPGDILAAFFHSRVR